MDFNKQLDDLENHVEQLKASVAAAAEENHEQLKQRIDQAQADTDRALAEAKQEASAAADKAQSSWEQTRSDAKARLDEFKAKAQHRADQVDADFAASDADWPKRTPTPRSTTPTGPSRTPGWRSSTRSTPASMPTRRRQRSSSGEREPGPGTARARLLALSADQQHRDATAGEVIPMSDPQAQGANTRNDPAIPIERPRLPDRNAAEPSLDRDPGPAAGRDRPRRVRRHPAARRGLRRGQGGAVVALDDAARGSRRRDLDRLRRERGADPNPDPGPELAAGGRRRPRGPCGRQHDPRTDRRRDPVRPVPPVGDPRRHCDGRDHLRRVLRNVIGARPAADRDGRRRRHGPA